MQALSQRLNASTTNFTQAANDYARSCPNAVVHVVNHGSADAASLIAALLAELRSRARFIGGATPQREAATHDLSNAIREALFLNVALPSPGPIGTEPVAAKTNPSTNIPASAGSVFLEWNDSLVDMDLELRIVAPVRCFCTPACFL